MENFSFANDGSGRPRGGSSSPRQPALTSTGSSPRQSGAADTNRRLSHQHSNQASQTVQQRRQQQQQLDFHQVIVVGLVEFV